MSIGTLSENPQGVHPTLATNTGNEAFGPPWHRAMDVLEVLSENPQRVHPTLATKTGNEA